MGVALLFSLVIGFLLIGVPIAVSLGLSSIIFLLVFSDSSLGSVAQTLFNAFAGHFTLLAIPFFILASTFMSTGGVAKRIIRFAIACVGHLHGGLAIAGVFACMLFAALSGSSPATVVAIGSIVIAGMVKVGYTKDFAAGIICNAGTLGILIPPSIVMVVYASAVDVSVGRMFLAGVIPGLVAGLLGGGMTSTPTLDAVRSGLVEVPAGFTADQMLTNIGAGVVVTLVPVFVAYARHPVYLSYT